MDEDFVLDYGELKNDRKPWSDRNQSIMTAAGILCERMNAVSKRTDLNFQQKITAVRTIQMRLDMLLGQANDLDDGPAPSNPDDWYDEHGLI